MTLSTDDWVPAIATRAYALDNALVDWLSRYGESKRFRP